MKFSASTARKGKKKTPWIGLVYGPEGVGKTTLGAEIPGSVFIDLEKSSEEMDVPRLEDDKGRAPQNVADVLQAIQSMTSDKHDFTTLVIDTVDALEALIWLDVAERYDVAHVGDIKYGQGYKHANTVFARVLDAISRMQDARGINVLFLGHSQIKTFNNPTGENYDRYRIKLHEDAASLLRERVKFIGFARYEEKVNKQKGDKKGKATGTGARFIYFQHGDAYDAKTRFELPSRLPLSWEALRGPLERGRDGEADKMRNDALTLLEQIEDAAQREKLRERLLAVGDDTRKLAIAGSYISSILAQQNEKEEPEEEPSDPPPPDDIPPSKGAAS